MVNRNYQKGRGFEYRWLKKFKDAKNLVRGERFYASKGITDVWYYLKDGTYHEDQLKYSSKRKPYISIDEMMVLVQYALDNPYIIVKLVSGRARREALEWNLSENI